MRHRPSWSLWTGIALVTLSGAVGCSDQPISAPPARSSAIVNPTAIGDNDPVGLTERASARVVTRALAQALRDPEARVYLKRALASSRVPELKLHLASFLTGRGGPILAAAAREARIDGESVRQALSRVRDVELYMPVPGQRGDWTGSQAPLVALALREDEPPEAYDSLGRSQLLNRVYPPAAPVLVLAPAEGDFRQQQPANLRGEAESDCVPGPNESLAGAARRCGNDGRTDRSERRLNIPMPTCEAANAMSCYPGLVLNELHLSNDECGAECWAWGDPEYQVHVYGKKLASDTKGYDLQCSGDGATPADWGDQPGTSNPAYYFDMNGRNWSGNALLFSAGQFTTLQAVDSVFVLEFWEDDSRYCVNTGATLSASLDVPLAFFGSAMGAFAWKDRKEPWLAGAWSTLAGLAGWTMLGDILNGGDDFVGGLVEKTHTPFSYGENVGRNTVIVRGGSYKGYANIGWRTGPTTTGSVASVVISDASPKIPLRYSKKLEAFAYDVAGFSISGLAVLWQSSNPSVASVDNTGLVTGNGLGTATITATMGGIQGSVVASVLNIGAAVSIRVTPDQVGGQPGNTMQLVPHLYDSNGFELPTTGGYNWSSDAKSICNVNGNGLVTAVAGGTTTVRVTNENLTATSSCTVSFGTQWMVVPSGRTAATGSATSGPVHGTDARPQPGTPKPR